MKRIFFIAITTAALSGCQGCNNNPPVKPPETITADTTGVHTDTTGLHSDQTLIKDEK